ncbi:MAG: hypothetical protein LKK13_05400 [Bacilli bacterium]|jgi:hypothetical protein|nr:hypothetical protein [Bacilli bacterium]
MDWLALTTTPGELEENLQTFSTLKWYIIPLLLIVMFIVYWLLHKKEYSVVFGAAAFWLMDIFNETWNSIVYATTGSPVWGTTAAGGSAFQILIGYNIEISFMFIILGAVTCLMLKTSPVDPMARFMDGNKNWLSDPNNMFYKANLGRKNLSHDERKTKLKAIMGRVVPALVCSVLAVCIECLLNYAGLLTWDKSWWQRNVPYLIFLIGYCPFFFSAVIVHDLPRKWQIISVGGFTAFLFVLILTLGCIGMLGAQIPLNWPFLVS